MARCRAGSLLRVPLLAALLLAALAALAAGAGVAPAGVAGGDALAVPAGPEGSSVKCKTCKKFLGYALDVIDDKYTRATIEAFLIAVRSPPPPRPPPGVSARVSLRV